MCLFVGYKEDYDLTDEIRSRGHVLVRGWKILESNGRSIMSGYPWEKGWNNAFANFGEIGQSRLRPRRFHKKTQRSCRSIGPGFHILLRDPREIWGSTYYNDRTIQTVWFFADEVRGAQVGGYGWCERNKTVVVNRALIKKELWR